MITLICKKKFYGYFCPEIDYEADNFTNKLGQDIYVIEGHDDDGLTTIFFDDDKKSTNYIWDYFMTEQEYRKLKLEKINDL